MTLLENSEASDDSWSVTSDAAGPLSEMITAIASRLRDELQVALATGKVDTLPAVSMDALPDELLQHIFKQASSTLEPRFAMALSSVSHGLRESTLALQQQLKEENAAAAALGLKLGVPSCKALREAKEISWLDEGLSATDLATLGKLIPVLPALEKLSLVEWSDSAGPDGGQLVEGLAAGALPAVTFFALGNVCVGDAGASALAAALDRGALPRLKHLYLNNTAIGDAGLVALAPALRRHPALKVLGLPRNPFGDEGLAALVAPPPADAPPPQAEVFAELKRLHLSLSQITEAGCAQLVSWVISGALPALRDLRLDSTSGSWLVACH